MHVQVEGRTCAVHVRSTPPEYGHRPLYRGVLQIIVELNRSLWIPGTRYPVLEYTGEFRVRQS